MNKDFFYGSHRLYWTERRYKLKIKRPLIRLGVKDLASPTVAYCATVYPSFLISLSPLGIPPSIQPLSILRDLMYISLYPSSIHCKVKEMNVSPGKIYSSSVYSPGAFTAITFPGQIYVFPFPSSLTSLQLNFYFPFPFISSSFGIYGHATDSKVNKMFPKRDTNRHTACYSASI